MKTQMQQFQQQQQQNQQFQEQILSRLALPQPHVPHVPFIQPSSYKSFSFSQKLAKFSGTDNEDYELWLADFKARVSTYQHMTEAEKITEFQCHLDGKARKSYQGIPKRPNITLNEIATEMGELFSITRPAEWARELDKIKRDSNENVRRFANRVSTLVDKAYPEYSTDGNERLRIHHFLKGLPEETAQRIIVKDIKVFKDAIKEAETYDTIPRKNKNHALNLMEEDVPIIEPTITKNNNDHLLAFMDKFTKDSQQQMQRLTKQIANDQKQHRESITSHIDKIHDTMNNNQL